MINNINSIYTPRRNPFGSVSCSTGSDYWLGGNEQNPKISESHVSILPDPIILNPEEARKTNNLKIIGLSIASVTVLSAAGIFLLLRGGPKGVAKGFQTLRNYLERKVQKSKLVGIDAPKYETMLNNIDYWTKRSQAINNFTTIKDFAFKKLMSGNKYTNKIHKTITSTFEKLGIKTLVRSYSAASKAFAKLEKANNQVILELENNNDLSKIITIKGISKTKQEWIELAKEKSTAISSLYKSNFNEENRKLRYAKIKAMTNNLEKSFNEKGILWFLKDDTIYNFVADSKIHSDKIKIQKNLKDIKQQISYTTKDLYKQAEETIMQISSALNPTDIKALKLLNKVRGNYKTMANGGRIDANIMNGDLWDLETEILRNTYARLRADIDIDVLLKDLKSLFEKFEPGNVEQVLDIYKSILPKEEYEKIAKDYSKAVKLLNKSIKLETDDFINKSRDLTLGSAPTDILTILGGFGTLLYYLGKSDNSQERTAITLKYGIPALVGIGASLYGNARLFAGSKSLAFAAISSFIANRIGTFANNIYENHLKETGKFIQSNKQNA